MALSSEITARFNAALQERPIDPELQKAREVVGALKTGDKVTDVAYATAVSIAANLLRQYHPNVPVPELFAMATAKAEAAQKPLHVHYTSVRESPVPSIDLSRKSTLARIGTESPHPFVPRSPEDDSLNGAGLAVTNTVYRIFDSVIPPAASLEIKQPSTTVSTAPRLVFQA